MKAAAGQRSMPVKKATDMKKIDRVETGIPGLDKLMESGLIKGSVTLVSGGAGAGKTIFCSQFIMHGLEKGEKCLYVTLEELPEDIKADVRNFGWEFDDFIRKKQLFIEYKDPFQMTDIVTPLVERIKKDNIQRVAIDSTSLLGLYFKDAFEIRKQLYKLVLALKSTGATSVLTAEIPEDIGNKLSRFGVEEFVVDGVIKLYSMKIGEGNFRSLQVVKMRRTRHAEDVFPFDFGKDGIVVKSKESMFKT